MSKVNVISNFGYAEHGKMVVSVQAADLLLQTPYTLIPENQLERIQGGINPQEYSFRNPQGYSFVYSSNHNTEGKN